MDYRNAYTFEELSAEKQQELLDYIAINYSKTKAINHKRTAYGLKQRYTRLSKYQELHVTSQCFMEAMLAAGFTAKPVADAKEPNWSFNVYVRKIRD